MRRFILSFILIFISVLSVMGNDYWKVTDSYVTVYQEEERIHSLGRLEKGEQFEAIGSEGTMLIFNYKGMRAYVASYCCKPVGEKQKQVKKQPVSAEHDSTVSASQDGEAKMVENQSSKRKATGAQPLQWLASVVPLFCLASIVVILWILFGHGSCERFFNQLADDYIACSYSKRNWRPAGILCLTGLVYFLTESSAFAFSFACVYEVGMLIRRTQRLGTFRAAFVESVYLGLYAVGTVFLCGFMLLLSFIAHGGPSDSKSSSSSNERAATCHDCRHYEHGSTYCSLGYIQNETCERFSG